MLVFMKSKHCIILPLAWAAPSARTSEENSSVRGQQPWQWPIAGRRTHQGSLQPPSHGAIIRPDTMTRRILEQALTTTWTLGNGNGLTNPRGQ